MKSNSPLLFFAAVVPVLASFPAAAQTRNDSATVGTGVNAIGTLNTNSASGTVSGTGSTVGINNSSPTTSANSSDLSTNSIGWSLENTYWRNNYSSRPYYSSQRNYSMYEPAYRYGVDLYNQNSGKSYSQLNQQQVSTGWTNARGSSNLDWSDAQLASRDAYERLYNANHTNTSITTNR